MSGQLFSQAPVMQAAPTLQAQPMGSALANALMRPTGMPNMPAPSLGIPLSTMMQLQQMYQNQGNQPPQAAPGANPSPYGAAASDASNAATYGGGPTPGVQPAMPTSQPIGTPTAGLSGLGNLSNMIQGWFGGGASGAPASAGGIG